MSDWDVIDATIRGMSDAQKRLLARVCGLNGGGFATPVKIHDDEVIPTHGPMEKLYRKGLVQGKAGGIQVVVHTSKGLEVYRRMKALEQTEKLQTS